jgi:hypothetical protein
MDADRFDAVARALGAVSSRRRALIAALGGLVPFGTRPADAKNGRTKKPKLNAFGCLNVGQKCRGKDSTCCSGICQGKKPKKGKKDRSTCVAHNTGGCTLDRDLCFNPQLAPCSKTAFCLTTTGNAPFCAENIADFCRPCGKDKDCEALGFGPGAACVILRTQGICVSGCEGVNGSSGTACLPPGA